MQIQIFWLTIANSEWSFMAVTTTSCFLFSKRRPLICLVPMSSMFSYSPWRFSPSHVINIKTKSWYDLQQLSDYTGWVNPGTVFFYTWWTDDPVFSVFQSDSQLLHMNYISASSLSLSCFNVHLEMQCVNHLHRVVKRNNGYNNNNNNNNKHVHFSSPRIMHPSESSPSQYVTEMYAKITFSILMWKLDGNIMKRMRVKDIGWQISLN